MWYKISQENNVWKAFPIVTLYHGTYAKNVDSIMDKGIVPILVDIKRQVLDAIKEITAYLDLSKEQVDVLKKIILEYSEKRLGESDFNKVYLSGAKSYATSNAGAGGEWYEMLLHRAIEIKYKDLYETVRSYRIQELNLYDQIKKIDEEYKEKPFDEDRSQRWDREREIERQIKDLRQEAVPFIEEQQNIEETVLGELLNNRFGSGVTVLAVQMPANIFKSKIASEYTQERVELFENKYKEYLAGGNERTNWFNIYEKYDSVWAFFQEVHLSSVEPEYIVGKESLPLDKATFKKN